MTDVHIGDATATLALAVSRTTELVEVLRGLALNHALSTEIVRLDAAGVAERASAIPWASVVVANHGTTTLTVAAGGREAGPPTQGRGVVDVAAGCWACLPLAGVALTLYGRAGETVGLTLLTRPQPPAAGTSGDAPWYPVALPGASGTLYTPPHGRRPILGEISVRESTGAAPATFRIRDTTAAGLILATIALNAGESTGDEYAHGKTALGTSLYYELVAGAVEGSVGVR